MVRFNANVDNARLVFYSVIGFAVGIFLMWRGFYWLKRKRIIEDIPTSKVRSIAMGLVEVKGKAKPLEEGTITAPLSGKKCLYYHYLIERYVSSGKSSHWKTIKAGNSTKPFYVEDNTGKVMVDPMYGEISVPNSISAESLLGRDPSPIIKSFLQTQNIRFEGMILGANYRMRYREWAITPEMHLYVMGTAADNPYVEEGTAAKGHEDIIIKRGGDKILMISDKDETKVLSRLKLKGVGFLIGGFLLSLLCLVIVLAGIGMF